MKKREDDPEMGISQTAHKERNFNIASEEEKKNKKKKKSLADSEVDAKTTEAHNIKDSRPEDHIANSGDINNGGRRRNSKTRKSKKPGKMEKPNDLSSNNFLDKRGEENGADDAEDEAYQMSPGDEDYSEGMKKWIAEYYQSRPGLKVLQKRVDEVIIAHEAKEEQARAEREAQAAEGGWTVVVQHKGRKKTTDAESGIAVGSFAQAAVLDKMAKRKKKEIGLDFYRFQKRVAHRNEVMMLQSKFEQDKKRIQQMRAARKFRPC